MQVGVILGDVPARVPPRDHLDSLLRQMEAIQRNGFRFVTMGHHYLYGDYRWLQPIPTLARLSAELDADVRLATTIVQVPLLHPVTLAEDLATLDIMTGGRLTIGLGAGYRPDEFVALNIPYEERFARFDEAVPLMQRLWTESHVTHEGRFWHLEDVAPHISPIQQPHPPLWIGAMSETGVRRAARLGDGWPVTPEATVPTMRHLMAVYEDERDRLGRPHVRHPLRREIVLGRTDDEAFERFERMARQRLVAYAQRSLASRDEAELSTAFRAVAEREAFVGTAQTVIDKIADLAAVVPIDPILVRVQWPDLDASAVVAYLDELGREVLPALREIESVARVVRED